MGRTTHLRSIRMRRSMSQEALEEASGVSQTVISKIERNGPTTGVLHAIALARALGVTVEELFADEGSARSDRRTRRLVKADARVEGQVSAA